MLTAKEIEAKRKIFNEIDIRMAAAFKVLSDVNRYRMFRILAEQPKISIGSLAKILKISLPLASQHLKMLSTANLLQKEREGKRVFPKLERGNPFVQLIIKTIDQSARVIRL